MAATGAMMTAEEIGRRGQAIYEDRIRAQVEPDFRSPIMGSSTKGRPHLKLGYPAPVGVYFVESGRFRECGKRPLSGRSNSGKHG